MLEFIIRHNGRDWTAENGPLTLSSPTLEGLDQKIGDSIRANGLLPKGEKRKVFMAFDNATIPQWIRQYAQHYFNRVVEFQGE